jgi:methionyl-tRNA formyltransferase
LDKLVKSNHQIAAVVTAPDKERGRGRKVTYTAVKNYALENNVPVLQPESLKDIEFEEQLKNYNADLFIIVAFRILPKSVFTIPKFGSFNLHGSLLPKYRGAAPIQWSLINGDNETGLTTFFLQEKVDTGNMILQEKIQIHDEDNFGTLHDKMSLIGADLVLKTVDLISSGEVNTFKQNESLATPAPKITKEICKINWNIEAVKVHNLVRGLSPFPGAYFIHNEKLFKVYKTELSEDVKLNPGEIEQTNKEIFIGCADTSIKILEIQPEGRKRMTSEEFLRGYSL